MFVYTVDMERATFFKYHSNPIGNQLDKLLPKKKETNKNHMHRNVANGKAPGSVTKNASTAITQKTINSNNTKHSCVYNWIV